MDRGRDDIVGGYGNGGANRHPEGPDADVQEDLDRPRDVLGPLNLENALVLESREEGHPTNRREGPGNQVLHDPLTY